MPGGKPTAIGRAIREARLKRGWTQQAVADQLNRRRLIEYGGCTANDVYRWESGRRGPRDWLPYLVETLSLDIGVLADQTCPTLTPGAQKESDPVDRREFLGAGAGLVAGVPLDSKRTESRLGQSDVDRLRRTLVDLRRLDDYTGGAAAYPLTVRAVKQAEGLLDKAGYSPRIGQAMLEVFAELCQFTSWVAFDTGRIGEARRLASRASAAANQAGNRILAASALSELSYLTASGTAPGEAVQMARASLALAPVDVLPVVRIVLADRLAWACARTGDASGVDRAIGLAGDLHDLRDSGTEEEPDWVYWINRSESAIMAGRCWAEIRQYKRAVPTLENLDMPYDETHAREVTLYECWLAGSYLDAGEVEQAVTSAGRAIDIVKGTDSPRTTVWVNGVLARLRDHRA
ncbi:helix-turn-helix domain-containing protein [Streptomyces jumonjinensis]|uniref:helix-turn-helix domain-containing protein n=1 Tax=Streptomyces jumonjinensis TaxID=1945 RepID=UPI003796A500